MFFFKKLFVNCEKLLRLNLRKRMAALTSISGVLGFSRAKHLLNRTTFGYTFAQLQQVSNLTIDAALNILFTDVATPTPPTDLKTGATWLNPAPVTDTNSEEDTLITYYKAWHLDLMKTAGLSVKERIVYFLHTHLPVQQSIVRTSTDIYYQNALYRYYAFGSYKTLFKKVIVDNAMLQYIDNHLNEKNSPNENFAREMFELYTIGKGVQVGADDYTNYTETDVQQAARVLTGFKADSAFTNLDSETLLPTAKLITDELNHTYLHDPGVKTFSSRFNNKTIAPIELLDGYATIAATYDELEQLVTMIFDMDETARFMCRKLYRFFVYYKITPEIETDIIIPLAQTFKDNNFEIKSVLDVLLRSQHFFDEDTTPTSDNHIGAIIKSPVELILGAFTQFEVSKPSSLTDFYNIFSNSILHWLDQQGMNFYEPIDVAGYPAYTQLPTFNRYWITPNTLPYRYKFIEDLINNSGTSIDKPDFALFVKNTFSGADNANSLVTNLTEFLFSHPVPVSRIDYYTTTFLGILSTSDWSVAWSNYIASGSDAVVKPLLEKLIITLLQSPEYQLL